MADTPGEPVQPSIVVHPSCLGRMEEFTPGSDWKHYVKRLEMFFEVNSIPTDKRVPSILTLMGSKMYALLRSISAPRRPKEFNFAEIVEILAQHVDPKPIIIAERYKFLKAEQEESETIRQYLAKLQKLAETCKFGLYREEAIRDRCPEKRAPKAKGGEIDSQKRCNELIVPVLIDGKSVDLELDTGASVTIIPNHVWSGVLAAKSLRQTDVRLKSYSGHEFPVLGEGKVQVSYGDQQAFLPVIVTAGDGPALMGRNWLSVLRLDWKQIKQISLEPCDRVESLVSRYASLFDGGLGTIKGVTAHLKLKENATPQFFKPRPVPFALKEKIVRITV
ncbi:Uncharacterized protein K02A2.6 [Stylophora pistillata]|uniref:Uncharacterized protein K02A2.6 n=1 Tax=Stylophora pistillata TaxID=50429 RepID=A0A2B4RI58_STYPI|nr:Uncharacterized protein K02A2.6 [Stylophora pistillata]